MANGRGALLPVLLAALVGVALADVTAKVRANEFGNAMLSEFGYDPAYRTFNHGSFGATPRHVTQALRSYQDRMEATPDPWFRGIYREEMREARAMLASYLGASTDDLVFVESASYAVNSVVRSMGLQAGDKIMYLNIAYPMVKNVFTYLQEVDGVALVEVTIQLPIADASEMVNAVRDALELHPETKLLSVCHISSTPAIVHPIEELAELAHLHGARILVDGAHAIGQRSVNIPQLGVDYYLSNAHKWLFAPKGSAILWVAPAYQEAVVPAVISSEFAGSTFVSRFEYTGTRDYSSMLAMVDALEFRELVGGENAIYNYIGNLSWWAGNHLASTWDTNLLAPRDMVGAMVDVRLPLATMTEATELQTWLFDTFGIYIVVHQNGGLTQPYTRLSSQIYLQESDFVELGGLVLDFARKLKGGQPKL